MFNVSPANRDTFAPAACQRPDTPQQKMLTLEYEEEDYDDDVDGLFSDSESLFVDTRKPVATPSEAGPSQTWAQDNLASPPPGPAKFNAYKRLDEIRSLKATVSSGPSRGANSLRNLCMSGEDAQRSSPSC